MLHDSIYATQHRLKNLQVLTPLMQLCGYGDVKEKRYKFSHWRSWNQSMLEMYT